jgi:hypothetical protein
VRRKKLGDVRVLGPNPAAVTAFELGHRFAIGNHASLYSDRPRVLAAPWVLAYELEHTSKLGLLLGVELEDMRAGLAGLAAEARGLARAAHGHPPAFFAAASRRTSVAASCWSTSASGSFLASSAWSRASFRIGDCCARRSLIAIAS